MPSASGFGFLLHLVVGFALFFAVSWPLSFFLQRFSNRCDETLARYLATPRCHLPPLDPLDPPITSTAITAIEAMWLPLYWLIWLGGGFVGAWLFLTGSVDGDFIRSYLFLVIPSLLGLMSLPFVAAEICCCALLVLRDNLQQQENRENGATDPRSYFLLLRSFTREGLRFVGQKPYRHQGINGTPPFFYYTDAGTSAGDAIRLVEQSVRALGRLIVVGGTLRYQNAKSEAILIRASDAIWQQVIRELALHCRAILMFPETTVGLLEEIKFLRESGLYQKVLVLVTPLVMLDPAFDRSHLAAREEQWNALRSKLYSHGYDLPYYDPNGFFYIPHENFAIAHQMPLGGNVSKESVDRCIHALLAHVPNSSESTAAMLARADRLLDRNSAVGITGNE